MSQMPNEIEIFRREDAIRAHQMHYAYLDKGNDGLIASGQAAIKNLFLMHGGALIAMLTFTSGIVNNSNSPMNVGSFVSPMLYFAIGLALATAASGTTYLTNFCYISDAHSKKVTWEHPYVEKTISFWPRLGTILHLTTVFFALTSLSLFVLGFISVKSAFSLPQ